jgi:hypothetical protein
MAWEPPTYTDEEILAFTEAQAAHWERVADISDPDTAFHCRDYAVHLRTLAECMRIDMLEEKVRAGPVRLPDPAAAVRLCEAVHSPLTTFHRYCPCCGGEQRC